MNECQGQFTDAPEVGRNIWLRGSSALLLASCPSGYSWGHLTKLTPGHSPHHPPVGGGPCLCSILLPLGESAHEKEADKSVPGRGGLGLGGGTVSSLCPSWALSVPPLKWSFYLKCPQQPFEGLKGVSVYGEAKLRPGPGPLARKHSGVHLLASSMGFPHVCVSCV